MARPVRTLENSDWVWATAFAILSVVSSRMSSIIAHRTADASGAGQS